MIPPATTLGLLLAGQRRLAAHVSLLGALPIAGLFLGLIIEHGNITTPIAWVWQVASALPFLYSAITLARVSVDIRVTAGEQRQARQLRASRRAAALTGGPAEEHQTPTAVLPHQ